MKMEGLLCMSVIMSVILLQSCSCIDENHLAQMVNVIWTNYRPGKMFSIAASIPKIKNQVGTFDFHQVLNTKNAEEVKNVIMGGHVYKTGRIVAATFIPKPKEGTKGNIHAEYRVLQNFDNLINQESDLKNDLMLFYVLAAPCTVKCTNENHQESILNYLKKLKKWTHYAVVFSYLYKPNNSQHIPDKDRKAGIERLGKDLGLKNVFRCVKNNEGRMQCSTCAGANNQAAQTCFSDSV
ncbi:uncharacterized protein LOC112157242 [Oryzias melastigma]|uniref:uncharacterized protein LOC112157242 n=1 Tax=Oryzias melastigma TaxID=30732 RepID=UPI000CF803DF|nr:uncharacterized protein LOC112157242 [Oryzias melastigma]XP_036069815.1 uncharacterized protein LOC112157242 [Oryzias melastigma]